MLILNLAAVARGPVRLQAQVPVDAPIWSEAGIELEKPLSLDLEARSVGEGVFVRGEMEADLAANCRRCLAPVPTHVRDTIDLLFEPLGSDEEVDLGGEVYALPERGDQLDLLPAIREQLVLRIPEYVLCSESCKGLCPTCGAELNRETCSCVPEPDPTPWDALRNLKFD